MIAILIFTLIFLGLDAYLVLSLLTPLRYSYPVVYGFVLVLIQLIIALMFWLFFVFFRSTAEQVIRFEKPLRNSAFYGMGLISFLFSFTAFRDLLALISYPVGGYDWYYRDSFSLIILGLSAAGFLVGSMNAQSRLFTPKVEVKLPKLPEALSGLRIVQLSDIHLGTGPGLKQVRRIVDRALEMKPHLIVLTGDIIDGNVDELKAELQEIARLRAPHGTYFVLGNHECYWKHEDAIRVMREIGITVLQNQGVEKILENHPIFIAGVNDPAIQSFQGEEPRIPIPPSHSTLNLILVHQPQLSKKIAEHPYHLQLSGHTHGGQFFPWNLAVKKIYPISSGLGKFKNLWVYVNMGSGFWGPPLRLGTQCEITELVLVKA